MLHMTTKRSAFSIPDFFQAKWHVLQFKGGDLDATKKLSSFTLEKSGKPWI